MAGKEEKVLPHFFFTSNKKECDKKAASIL